MIENLQLIFKEPINRVRETLKNLHMNCSHGHYVHLDGTDTIVEFQGHPLPCCFGGCFSQLRILRAASVHFPCVRSFLRMVYSIRSNRVKIAGIDVLMS